MGKEIRLNRFIARSGLCSRRKADEYIRQGLVKVNGQTITQLGVRINPLKDRVEVDRETIAPIREERRLLYLAMNKPRGIITSLRDPQGRQTIVHILPLSLQGKGIVPIGRLDYHSEGLLLLSNDGEFVHRMSHPRFHLKKKYLVEIEGVPSAHTLAIMRKGMFLKGLRKRLAPVGVDVKKRLGPSRYLLLFTLVQGINRQIRRMCEQWGWKVTRLIRIQQGPIALGNLAPGEIRPLNSLEIKRCKAMIGLL